MTLIQLNPGEEILINGRHYARCRDCGKVLRVNKPIFGSIHLCLSEHERAMVEDARHRLYLQRKVVK